MSKLISEKEIRLAVELSSLGFTWTDDDWEDYMSGCKAIAQAQLEADQGMVKAKMQEIFEEINAKNMKGNLEVINTFGKRKLDTFGLLLTSESWQALKQKYGVEVNNERMEKKDTD